MDKRRVKSVHAWFETRALRNLNAMTRKKWKNKIKKACQAAGTYQPFFDPTIETLAAILEVRDAAEEKYLASGSSPVIKHTTKGGNTNIVKNPALVVLMDCNATALAYWRELGLTSRSFKAMTGTLAPVIQERSLEDALAELGI